MTTSTQPAPAPTEPAGQPDEVELTRMQQHLWFAAQSGHPAGYLVPMQWQLTGALDVPALDGALRMVVARHTVLRTGVRQRDDGLVGVVWPAERFALEVRELSPGELEAARYAEATRPLDLADELPLRARLLRTAPNRALLCLTVHHIAFDDWSRRVLCTELAAAYAALTAGTGPVLPPVTGYRELVAGAADPDPEDLAFWRSQLAGRAPFELPAQRPRPARRAGRGEALRLRLAPPVVSGLRELAGRHSATLAMVLFAGCQGLLARWSGRPDVTLGTTLAQRTDPRGGATVGPCITMVVLAGQVPGDPTFAELVAGLRETALDAYDHASVPFDALVAELAERDPSRTPLFQVMVGYGAGSPALPALTGLRVSDWPAPGDSVKYDLYFWFQDADGGAVTVEMAWNSDLYRADTMADLAADLADLFAGAADEPQARLSELVAEPPTWSAAEPLDGDEPAGDAGTDDAQQLVAQAWAEVLGVPAVGEDDDFFALGGHSLLVLRATNRMRDRLGVEVPLSLILEHPTVRGSVRRLVELHGTL